jgi:hypothetical protein
MNIQATAACRFIFGKAESAEADALSAKGLLKP